MKDCWVELQAEVAGCTQCDSQFPKACVDCPPALLYPEGIRPSRQVRVLFVGVAPPENGSHFYTDSSDNLRRGLFEVLEQLGRPCSDIPSFVARGFFLVHAAKCAIRGTTKPNLRVSKFCASIHLRKEVECLMPDGLCFLSKNIGFPVYTDLSCRWHVSRPPEFGEMGTLTINGRSTRVITTAWPGRGHEALTQLHVDSLFRHLDLPTWKL